MPGRLRLTLETAGAARLPGVRIPVLPPWARPSGDRAQLQIGPLCQGPPSSPPLARQLPSDAAGLGEGVTQASIPGRGPRSRRWAVFLGTSERAKVSRQVLRLVRSMSKSELPKDHLEAACVLGGPGTAPKSRPLSRQTWWPPLWGPLGEARRERPAERVASPGGVLHLHPGGREVRASLPVKIKVNAASAPTRCRG